MINNRLKGLLISSTVLLAFIGTVALSPEKVLATPEVEGADLDKKVNEEALNKLLKDVELTQEKVDKLLEEQEAKLQEKEKLSNDISTTKVNLDNKQTAIDELNKSNAELKKELSKVEAELSEATSDLKKSDYDLKHINAELSERKEVMSKKLMKLQLKDDSHSTIVKVIFESESIEDALTNVISISILKSAEDDMLDSLAVMESEKKELSESILKVETSIKKDKEELVKSYAELSDKQDKLEKEKEAILGQQEAFEKLLEDSEEAILDNADYLKEQQETITNLQTAILEVVSNLDAIADAERIEELAKIQSQLTIYSGETITYRASSLLSNSEAQQKLIEEAEKYLGIPYVWGGATPLGFDCSGLMQYIYKEALGITLPRVTTQQDKVGTEVALEDIQVGDLIFWGEPSHHVAIYAGNGYYIHAPSTGDVVKYANRPLTSASYIKRIL